MPKEINLNQKHLQALELLSRGDMSIKAVAEKVGFKPDSLYDLVEGNVDKAGACAELFNAEMKKVDKKLAKKIKSTLRSNKVIALKLINDILFGFQSQGVMGEDEIKILIAINNSLSKEAPNVEIGNLSYSFTQGLSVEEILHEFNRLRTIAVGSSNRAAVRKPNPGRPKQLPGDTEPNSPDEEPG